MQKHDLSNKLEKVVVNVGIGRLSTQPNFDAKILPEIIKELAIITGQKPSPRNHCWLKNHFEGKTYGFFDQ